MAGRGGYRGRKSTAERIAAIDEKIAKQNEMIKECEERINALEAERQQIMVEEHKKQMNELIDLLNEKNISVEELRAMLDKGNAESDQ